MKSPYYHKLWDVLLLLANIVEVCAMPKIKDTETTLLDRSPILGSRRPEIPIYIGTEGACLTRKHRNRWDVTTNISNSAI